MRPGVGVLFNPALADFVVTRPASLDYLSVIPDRSWIDHGPGAVPRFEALAATDAILNEAAASLPMIMHCIGMSICSADVFDEEYLDQLVRWRSRYSCAWVAEHLSFSRIGAGHESNSAIALPIPYDHEMLRLLGPRIHAVQSRLGCPFLLENNVYYFAFPEQDMTEAEFLNQLTQTTGCALLLDLHNVYTNSRNHKFEARSFLSALDLSRVLEIHIAGGSEMMGFHTDSHTGPVHNGVWELLAFAAPQCTALRGVTFEFHESSWPLLHEDGVLAQIDRARSILAAC